MTNKVLNTKLKYILQSDTANYVVDSTAAYGHSKLLIIFKMSGISNLTVEEPINNENEKEIWKRTLSVYSLPIL